MCKAVELFGGELKAIDLRKFLAVNSDKRNFNNKKLEPALNQLQPKITKYLNQLEAQDRDKEVEPVITAQELQEKIELLKQRRVEDEQV